MSHFGFCPVSGGGIYQNRSLLYNLTIVMGNKSLTSNIVLAQLLSRV